MFAPNAILGTLAGDRIEGTDDADVLNGLKGDDTISAGAGNDFLQGYYGADILSGGSGDDRLGITYDTLVDTVFGGDGFDTFIFTAPLLAPAIVLAGDAGSGARLLAGGSLIAQLSQIEAFYIVTGNGSDRLSTGAGNDTINGFGGSDTIDSGAGDDTVRVTVDAAADALDTGLGQDLFIADYHSGTSALTFGFSADKAVLKLAGRVVETITGAERIQVNGGTGNDYMAGGSGNETLNGGDGIDTISAGLGRHLLDGGAGDDVIAVVADDKFDRVTGGDGKNDRLQISAEGIDAVHTALVGPGFYELALDGVVRLSAAGIEAIDVHGGRLGDRLVGLVGADNLDGNGGDDIIDGNDGSDILHGGDGNDSITGGGENDTGYGDAGNDYIDDTQGNDTYSGGAGLDTIGGGVGNDRLLGDGDADSLTGGTGFDTVYGGDGNDTILGIGDNDLISGDLGNDSLSGGIGDDTVNGGDGNDWIAGDPGADKLSGGAGADRFYFMNPFNQGIDQISDFQADDVIQIERDSLQGFGVTGVVKLVLSGQALPSVGVFIYNSATGLLSWDGDGSESRFGPQSFATLLDNGRPAHLDASQIIPLL